MLQSTLHNLYIRKGPLNPKPLSPRPLNRKKKTQTLNPKPPKPYTKILSIDRLPSCIEASSNPS